MTYEVNTPSHEQCVMAHIERNASRLLLRQIQEKGSFLPDKEIEEIDYLDPFDIKPHHALNSVSHDRCKQQLLIDKICIQTFQTILISREIFA